MGALLIVPHMVELNIGHSIVSRSILVGLGMAIKELLFLMEPYSNLLSKQAR